MPPALPSPCPISPLLPPPAVTLAQLLKLSWLGAEGPLREGLTAELQGLQEEEPSSFHPWLRLPEHTCGRTSGKLISSPLQPTPPPPGSVLLLKGAVSVGGSGGQGEWQAHNTALQGPAPLCRPPSMTSSWATIKALASPQGTSVWIRRRCPFLVGGGG